MIDLFSILTTIFWFLVIITIIVFIHEMGHLLVARLFGVKVEEFSLGFGKELAHYRCKQKTRWKLSAINFRHKKTGQSRSFYYWIINNY